MGESAESHFAEAPIEPFDVYPILVPIGPHSRVYHLRRDVNANDHGWNSLVQSNSIKGREDRVIGRNFGIWCRCSEKRQLQFGEFAPIEHLCEQINVKHR